MVYEKLWKKRKDTKTPVEELKTLLGFKGTAAYYKKETGQVRFTIDEAIILAKFYNTTLDELFNG